MTYSRPPEMAGMEVTFLGTGSAMPTPQRHQTGLLVQADDRTLLIDCGAGVLHRLAGTDPGYEGIDAILLTHHHLDHLSDLLALLKARWLAGTQSIPLAGPPGTTELVTDLLEVHEYLADKVNVDAYDVTTGDITHGEFTIAATETRHSMPCFAYRIQGPNGDLVYSGDTEAFSELASFADGAATLIHDCSFPDEVEVSNHPTPTALGQVLRGHSFGTVFLTHLYPHAQGRDDDLLASITKHYDGEVKVAKDQQTVTV